MKTQILFILTLGFLVLFSCREVDQFIPVEENVPFQFRLEFTGPADTLIYELHLEEPRIIRTPKGTEFVFKPEMFVFENGAFCECRNVRIEIIELDKKRDYLVHEASTVSNGKMLISAGAYHVAAFESGKPLKLAPEHLACFWLPSNKLDTEMKLFFGERTAANGFNWIAADTGNGRSSITPGQWQYNDTSAVIVGYQCFSEKLEWINVDKYITESSVNPVCIKLDTAFNRDNTVVFAVLKKEHSILKLNYTAGEGFCVSGIPVGTEVIFIGVRKTGTDKYELASDAAVIEPNHFQTLSFETTDFTVIKDFLSSL